MKLIKLVVLFTLFFNLGPYSLFAKSPKPHQNKAEVKKKEKAQKGQSKVVKNKKDIKKPNNKKQAKMNDKNKVKDKKGKVVGDRKPASVKKKIKNKKIK